MKIVRSTLIYTSRLLFVHFCQMSQCADVCVGTLTLKDLHSASHEGSPVSAARGIAQPRQQAVVVRVPHCCTSDVAAPTVLCHRNTHNSRNSVSFAPAPIQIFHDPVLTAGSCTRRVSQTSRAGKEKKPGGNRPWRTPYWSNSPSKLHWWWERWIS